MVGSQKEALRERRAALAELGLVWGGQGGAVREPRWRVRCERVEEFKVAAVSARTDQQRLVETFHGCVEWSRRCSREQGARVGREFWVLHTDVAGPRIPLSAKEGTAVDIALLAQVCGDTGRIAAIGVQE